MRKLFSLFLILNIYFVSYGVYLEKLPYQLVQPNGEVLHVFITGDEFYRRVHDNEGYSIVQGSGGWYYYATYDAAADELIPSEYIVSASQNVVLPMAKGLGISFEKYMEKRRNYYELAGSDVSGVSKNSILKSLENNNTKGTTQMNNIVICIGFSDTPGMTRSFDYVDGMFNSNTNNNLKDFFSQMSYEKLSITSHFHPPADGTTLRFYQDFHPRNYYLPYSETNPMGYSDSQYAIREHTLLRNAVNWVNANYPVPSNLNLDINNDGKCDYVTFIVYGPVAGWSDLLWPHKWSLFTYNDVTINGKRVYDYNFELDGSSGYFNVGTFCHEGYHVLGAPDLYHYLPGFSQAVGAYDLMESTNNSKPQSMSAYMKYKYGKWIPELPIATINKTYEIFPFYTNNGTDPDKPVMYRIPMTNTFTEYSVVEYRKKTGNNYDSSLPNEGLMIYRINSTMTGNAGFDGSYVDEVYLYRPGSIQTNSIYSQGNLNLAPYNTANGKTSFNYTTDPKPCGSYGTAENNQNINHILYHEATDSYTFFYGDPENMDIVVNKTELVIGKLAGSPGTVTVISNILWQVSVPESAADWLSVSKTKGMNNDKVKFTALKDNDSGVPRSVNVVFSGNGKTFTVNVIQDIVETAACEEEISNLNVDINSNTLLATLNWEAPGIPAPKGAKGVLWNNTEEETSSGFQSCRWIEGDDRIVMADDFDIPDNDASWAINEIYFKGLRNNSSPLPDFIGIAIYKDNGNNRPQNTPIYEKSDLIPVEGVISGKMHLLLPEPVVISEPGKYWLSIYGTYNGPYDSKKTFNVGTTSKVVEERMCMWDPTGLNGCPSLYCPGWGLAVVPLHYGLFFSLSGTVTYPDRISYDIYLDGNLIASDIKKTSYKYPKPVKMAEDHNWCVKTICTSGMESPEEVCFQTQSVIYDVNIVSNPFDGGTVSGSGTYGHGDIVIAVADANDGYLFAGWSKNGVFVKLDNPYQFPAKEDMTLYAHFEIVLPFDTYVVTKWNNTFMLNVKQLKADGYDVNACKWYKNRKLIGEDFSYSAGNKRTDLLEVGANYTFELNTNSYGKVHSTIKFIETNQNNVFKVYPNPVPQGNKLTIEGTVQGNLIEVYNYIGTCVSRTTAMGNITELTLNVPKGIYAIRIDNKVITVIFQ